MRKKCILHGKWAEMEEMDSKKHSSTRRGNTKKRAGGAPARAGRCRQLDDVIRRRAQKRRAGMSATSRRNAKKRQRSGLSSTRRRNTKKRQRSGLSAISRLNTKKRI